MPSTTSVVVVSREALTRVYDKVWKAGAEKGDLATFLGPDPAAAGSGGGSGKQQEE